MEHKEAKEILLKLLDINSLNKEEKSAIITALGTLDWFILGKNRANSIIRAKKAKKDKDLEI
jgi:hypothetical protein